MSIIKRNDIWYIDIRTESGKRVRRSTGVSDKQQALELHDKIKHELWQQERLGARPERLWDEAAIRWLTEKEHKKSLKMDKFRIKNLPRFRGIYLNHMNRDFIMETIANLPCSNSTKNRYLAVVRGILNKCAHEWGWLDQAPKLTQYVEPKRRIRWLSPLEAKNLLDALPNYMATMAEFSLCTGLRQMNVVRLQWSQVDLERGVAWFHQDELKNDRALGVTLNQSAISILNGLVGGHAKYVFLNSQGRPVKSISSRFWKKAVEEAGLENFRWHDLRHTWASWLVQKGVPLSALQEMGGWESVEMVRRYAHLAPEHLHQHAIIIDQVLNATGHKKDPNKT